MPFYVFDIDDRGLPVRDAFGLELADIREALDQAVARLQDLTLDGRLDGDEMTSSATVRDPAGTVLYQVMLSFRGGWSLDDDRARS